MQGSQTSMLSEIVVSSLLEMIHAGDRRWRWTMVQSHRNGVPLVSAETGGQVNRRTHLC
jgi:hypothetical protein